MGKELTYFQSFFFVLYINAFLDTILDPFS